MAKAAPLYVASARAMWGSASPLPVFPYPVAHALVQPWPDEKKRRETKPLSRSFVSLLSGNAGVGLRQPWGERGWDDPPASGLFSESGCHLHVERVIVRVGGCCCVACGAVVREGVVELEKKVLSETVVGGEAIIR